MTPTPKRALAQPSAQWAPVAAAPGDEVNLFADFTPTEPTDGLTIDARSGWEVMAVEAVRLGRSDRVEFSLRRTVQGVFAESDERLVGRHRLIITLKSPSTESRSTVSVVPTRLVNDVEGVRLEPLIRHEVEFDLNVEESRYSSGQALLLKPFNMGPFEADAPAGFDSPDRSGLTVAFWMGGPAGLTRLEPNP